VFPNNYAKLSLFSNQKHEMSVMNDELKVNPMEIINQYYPVGSKVHFILVKHSEQVRDKALSVAQRHPELNLDTQFIAEAAMLHDIGIFYCEAPRIHCHGTHQYIEHGYLGADLLRSINLPKHALVCERHTGVGLSLEMIKSSKLPLPLRDMIPLSLEEQVICYADKFYSKTQLDEAHPIDRIRKYLGRYGENEVRKFDEWHTQFE